MVCRPGPKAVGRTVMYFSTVYHGPVPSAKLLIVDRPFRLYWQYDFHIQWVTVILLEVYRSPSVPKPEFYLPESLH